jgi:hypothetical protein
MPYFEKKSLNLLPFVPHQVDYNGHDRWLADLSYLSAQNIHFFGMHCSIFRNKDLTQNLQITYYESTKDMKGTMRYKA